MYCPYSWLDNYPSGGSKTDTIKTYISNDKLATQSIDTIISNRHITKGGAKNVKSYKLLNNFKANKHNVIMGKYPKHAAKKFQKQYSIKRIKIQCIDNNKIYNYNFNKK